MSVEFAIRMGQVRLPHGGAEAVAREAYDYFLTMRTRATQEVRSTMRVGASMAIGDPSEVDSVTTVVSSGANPSLQTRSGLIKSAVDEAGRVPGSRPPFGPNSALWAWVFYIFNPPPKQMYATARGVAMAIQARGLPRPGDPLRAPFATAFRSLLPEIQDGLRAAAEKAARSVNNRTAL